jgi:prophage DNA circulation protein
VALTKSAASEAGALAVQIAQALSATVAGQSGQAGAELQYLCGQFIVEAADEFAASFPGTIATTVASAGTFCGDFTACFDQAQTAGATFVQFEIIRQLAESAKPQTPAGIAVKNYCVRMALVEEARILAATTFTSRNQIDAYIDQMNESFDCAEVVAADNLDNVAYQALIRLHGAVTNDLSTRAFKLPQLVAVSYNRRLPALYLAQRLYQDASQALSIVQQNDVTHPLFCGTSLQVLSSAS